jgi:hypothetical protein
VRRTLACGFLATLAVLASAPFAHAAAGPTTQWRTVFRARTTWLTSVAASGPRSAWAAGFTSDPSYVMHWNGRAWRRMPLLPAHFQVTDVAGTAPSDVWVSGHPTAPVGNDEVYRWNGRTWQLMVPRIAPVTLLPIAPDNVWVESQSGFLLHWDGTTWHRFPFPQGLNGWPDQIAAVGNQLWDVESGVVAGHPHRFIVRRWDGSGWERMRSPHPKLGRRFQPTISAVSATNVWVDTQSSLWKPTLMRWDGRRWTTLRVPSSGPFVDFPIAAAGRSGVWAGQGSALWLGGAWHFPASGCGNPVGVPGTTSALCAGDSGGPAGRPEYGVIAQAGPLP